MQKNELKSGVILSYINLGLGTVIPFIYTPIMLRMLGQAEYGLFSLASSAVSYLSLLDSEVLLLGIFLNIVQRKIKNQKKRHLVFS